MLRLAGLRVQRHMHRFRSRPVMSAMETSSPPCVLLRTACSAASQSDSGGKTTDAREKTTRLFVSKHFRIESKEIEAHLRQNDLKYRRTEEHAIVEECPFCKPTKGEADNLYKLYVALESGVYFCHRCKSKGSWFDFRKHLGGRNLGLDLRNPISNVKVDPTMSSGAGAKKSVLPKSGVQERYVRDLWGKHSAARRFLNETRGLNDDVLKHYGVGAGHFPIADEGRWNSHLCITFPMYDGEGQLVRHKVRSIETKRGMRLEPKGGSWGMFGLNVVPSDMDEVVITEGELDALSVFQGTGRPAVSLPNGASSLPLELLPPLERFKKIYLWMDADAAGQDGAELFCRKLGLRRCLSVPSLKCKDANDALREKQDMEDFLSKARVLRHEGILTFADIQDEVWYELANIDVISGLKSQSLPRLNDFITGHRHGELTIFSGHTGIGKTTILSQLALDFCTQGVPTLWGSFEVANVRLVRRLLQQFKSAHGDMSSLMSKSNFYYWADRFSELPMYYMRYHGSEDLDRIMETMEYANYVHDCRHIVLDNLQFMTGTQGRGHDRFAALDNAVGRIRDFCTARKAHVSLVVHPRKELDNDLIQTASVFGSAKATQEADNVVIMQRGPNGPILDVRKNRFDGNLGSISLRFDKKRELYSQVDSNIGVGWLNRAADADATPEATTNSDRSVGQTQRPTETKPQNRAEQIENAKRGLLGSKADDDAIPQAETNSRQSRVEQTPHPGGNKLRKNAVEIGSMQTQQSGGSRLKTDAHLSTLNQAQNSSRVKLDADTEHNAVKKRRRTIGSKQENFLTQYRLEKEGGK